MKVRTLDREKLAEKGFTPEKNVRILNLFSDDFGSNSAWNEVCDVLCVDPEQTSQFSIAFIGVNTDDMYDGR